MDDTQKEEVKYIYEEKKTKTISDLEVVRSIPSVIECKAKKTWKIRRRIFDHYMSEKKNGINTQKFFTSIYIYILVFIL